MTVRWGEGGGGRGRVDSLVLVGKKGGRSAIVLLRRTRWRRRLDEIASDEVKRREV